MRDDVEDAVTVGVLREGECLEEVLEAGRKHLRKVCLGRPVLQLEGHGLATGVLHALLHVLKALPKVEHGNVLEHEVVVAVDQHVAEVSKLLHERLRPPQLRVKLVVAVADDNGLGVDPLLLKELDVACILRINQLQQLASVEPVVRHRRELLAGHLDIVLDDDVFQSIGTQLARKDEVVLVGLAEWLALLLEVLLVVEALHDVFDVDDGGHVNGWFVFKAGVQVLLGRADLPHEKLLVHVVHRCVLLRLVTTVALVDGVVGRGCQLDDGRLRLHFDILNVVARCLLLVAVVVVVKVRRQLIAVEVVGRLESHNCVAAGVVAVADVVGVVA